MIQDSLTPEQRFQEYENLEKHFREIEKMITEHPDAFPNGIEWRDDENDFLLTLYADEKGAYAALTSGGKTAGITADQMLEFAQRHFLITNSGLDLLINAVAICRKPYVINVGYDRITIFPTRNGEADFNLEPGVNA